MTDNKVDFYRLGSELWNIANIFRDDTLKTTEYLEEFSYFLFLKLFDEQDNQKEEIAKLDGKLFVSDLPEELRFNVWAEKILNCDGKTVQVGKEDVFIVDYVKNIFAELAEVKDNNGKDLSLFRRLFKNHIWRIKYNPTIRELIKRLKDLQLEQNFDVMGRAYEFVVQKLGEQKQYGQYFTPRHIIHFMVELANPEIGDTIYDPAAGTGGFILRAFEVVKDKIQMKISEGMKVEESTTVYNGTSYDEAERLLRNLKERSIFAVEKAPDVYKLALMNMILHNDGKSNLVEADSLDNRAQLEHKERYDIVLSNPPYGPLTQSRVGTFDFHTKRFEALFIQHIMSSLKYSDSDFKRSRAAVIILDKVIFDNSAVFKNIRIKLLREYNLIAVFSMPAGIFQPYSGVKTTVLYFERPTKEEWNTTKKNHEYSTKQVLFVDVKDDGFTFSTQRRPINNVFQGNNPNIYEPPCGNLPKSINVFNKWIEFIKFPQSNSSDFIDNDFCWFATIEEIKQKDYNLNPGLYKKIEKGKCKWDLHFLRDIILSLETGKRPQGGVAHITEGVPSIGGEHIDHFGGLDLTDLKYVPEDFYNTLNSGIIEPNDILLVKDGATTGKVALVTKMPFEKAAVNEHVYILKVNQDKVLPEYLFYVLYSEYGQNEIISRKKGAAQGGITRDILDSVSLPIPPIQIQEEIELRLNKQQAIIEQCKLIEKSILDAGIDSCLFDGQWTWATLDDVAAVTKLAGFEYTKYINYQETGDIIMLKAENVRSVKIDLSKDLSYIDKSTSEKLKRSKLHKGDLVMTYIGVNVGDTAIIEESGKFHLAPNVAKISIKNQNQINPYFFNYLFNSNFIKKQINYLLTDTAKQNINMRLIRSLKVPIIPIERQLEIVNLVNVQYKVLDNIRKLKENSQNIIKLIINKEVYGN